MRVYLAAPYQLKDVINIRAAELRALGMEVTSQWLDEPHKATIELGDLPHEEHQYLALRDIADISEADVFVLQPDVTGTIKRAGRTVEFGVAIGIGLTRPFPILIVGPGEDNIFYHMPQVYHYFDWEETKARLVELAAIATVELDSMF